MTALARWGMMALSLLLVVGYAACTRGPASGGTARVAAPERIACGLTGLQTGRGQGFVVHADGRVEAWAGRTMAEGVVSKGIAPADSVAALWTSVRAADLFGRDEQAVGVTAAFVQVDTAEQSHRVSWAVGPSAEPVDSVLARVYDLCEQTAGLAR